MHITEQQFKAFSNPNEPQWFTEYRRKSFACLEKSALPAFKYGLNIVIRPALDLSKVRPGKFKGSKNIVFDENTGVKVYSGEFLPEMEQEHASRLKLFLHDRWNDSDNIVYHFHQAFANDFTVIHIPQDAELKAPIEIALHAAEGPVLSSVFVMAGRNARATVMLHKSSEYGAYLSDDIRVIADENSNIELVTVQNADTGCINFQKRKSFIKKNASVHWADVCMGAAYTKSDVVSCLEAEGASANTTVLFLAAGKQQYDIYTASLHNAPRTVSNILTKGVLNGAARALSRGLVRIAENAYGSNGYEKQDALLLSNEAEADAIPNLEIYNHDVKCTHGSTVGQIDAEKLFYLMSRGLDEEKAKCLIIEGYFTPVLAMFKDEHLKEKLHSIITDVLQ